MRRDTCSVLQGTNSILLTHAQNNRMFVFLRILHLDLLFARTKAPLDYPAFSYRTSRGDLTFVSHKLFTQRLKRLLSLSGFSPEKFSGHSLRRGGATFLYKCGASILEIQACGDWASTVFTRYLFVGLEERLLSQGLMAQHLPRSS